MLEQYLAFELEGVSARQGVVVVRSDGTARTRRAEGAMQARGLG